MTKARDLADLGNGVTEADIAASNSPTNGYALTAQSGNTGGLTWAEAGTADDSVSEAKLQVSNAPTNGYFLSAQSGNTGGMTWAEAGGDPSGGSTSTVNLASTSGATLTGIPAGVQRLTVILENFGDAGTTGLMPMLELGTSSALQTSGYAGNTAIALSSSTLTSNSGSAFPARVGDANGVPTSNNFIKYDLIRMPGSNSWFETVSGMGKSRGIVGGSGNVTLSAELTQVRIWFYQTTSPYTTNFSQGTIRLSWEY